MKKTDDDTTQDALNDKIDENVQVNIGDDQSLAVQLQSLQLQIEELKNKYLRALADYQNLEKRAFQEKTEARVYASEITLRKFIPAIDSLERATKHIKDEGLDLSLKEFNAALAACGVKRIETMNTEFDPFTMECLEVVPGKDGNVVEEVLSGYMLHDKVLRVAQVKVGKK